MDFSLTETQRLLQESVSAFARERGEAVRCQQVLATEPGYCEQDWRLMAELGWFALLLPEDMGGIGGGPVEAMLLMEALGTTLARSPYFSTAILAAGCLLRHASAAQRARYLAPLAEGRLPMAVAHGEHGAHEHRYAVALRAWREGGTFTLNGDKHTVFDAPAARAFILSARTAGADGAPEGITWFLVPADTPGLSLRPFRRLDGGRAAHLRLRDLHLPADAVLGTVDGGAVLVDELYAHGIAALCGEALGVMQVMHDDTLSYLKTRRQFGRPIGSFQALQHRMVDMYAALEEARSLTLAANMALAEGAPAAGELLAMAKVQTGRSGRIVGEGAIQLHGGIGMTDELAVGRHFKRMTVIGTQFGSGACHLARLAASQA